MPLSPTVLWAQRADLIYLTVEVADIKNETTNLNEKKIHFNGVGGEDKNEYEFEIKFYKEDDIEQTKKALIPRNLMMTIYKMEVECWPHIQNGPKLDSVNIDSQR